MPRHRRQRVENNIWPGFVDALSALLLTFIFMMVIYTLAQFVLSYSLSGKDEALSRLTAELSELQSLLSSERSANEDLRENVSQLSAALNESTAARDLLTLQIADLQRRASDAERRLDERPEFSEADRAEMEARIAELLAREAALARRRDESDSARARSDQELNDLQALYFEAQDRITELENRVLERQTEIADLNADLTAARNRLTTTLAELDRTRESLDQERDARQQGQAELTEEQRISEAARRQVNLLNLQLADLRKQLAQIQALLDEFEAKDAENKATIADLGQRLNRALAAQVEKLSRYRSEFFGRLREVLRGQQGIRIVGDRFVFQSEVLFGSGSAEMGVAGRIQLTKLAETLIDISRRIPDDINWILRVDGHTDSVPISTPRFPSNWELSAARAIAVSKYLILQGLPPDRLAPTGFGEFHPIEPGDSELARRRNRRIELKLTER
ncbi:MULTISPECIES: peptidoglycan -binding protein [unclassified Minwuia]|jgi:chemotaxis protein MotB|uniref:peptidoglycan -binding protein n=1 Tax=unclassified Minwuia TaxID=2618799 RepID=UPI0024787681|nr:MULTISPECIES: peptidoglycan -binding protein [unclassified Minwuia]